MTFLSAWLRIPHSDFKRLALALFATAAGRTLRPRLRGSARPSGRRVAFASAALVIVGLLAAGLVAGSPGVNADADCQVPPTDLSSTFDAEASAVLLSWLAPASCAPDEYAVYRRDMSADGGKMLKIATVEGDSLSYPDTSAEAGKTYRYRIRSNDQGPRSGLTSIDVPALEPDPTPPSDDLNDRVVRAEPTFNNTAFDLATRSVWRKTPRPGPTCRISPWYGHGHGHGRHAELSPVRHRRSVLRASSQTTGQLQTSAGVTYDFEDEDQLHASPWASAMPPVTAPTTTRDHRDDQRHQRR